MKVSLFLRGCQFEHPLEVGQEGCLPETLARSQTVLKVVDSESGTLALSTLGIHQ